MLDSLRIENFRIFEKLVIPKLGRVNLITGKNNTGKSSLLEALRILCTKARPSVLQNIAYGHDEVAAPATGVSEDRVTLFQNFFNGRHFPEIDDRAIYIGDVAGSSFVEILHELFESEFEELKDETTKEISRRRKRNIVPKGVHNPDVTFEQMLTIRTPGRVNRIDIFDGEMYQRRSPYWDRFSQESDPLSLIPTRFLSSETLASQWDAILFSAYADHVKEALRLIDEDLEDIGFIKKSSRSEERYALVKKRGSNEGIPLSSMGDGVLRILQLALGLFQAKGGLLLIDEFENGLHHTVQNQVWEKLFKLAVELDVQVFATSHSNDSVHAFAKAALDSPEQGVLINLAKSALGDSKGAILASIYDEEKLKHIVSTEIEVRV